jgi:hypothetical protein
MALAAVVHGQTADRLKALPPFPSDFFGKWRMVTDSTPPLSFTRNGDVIEGAVAGRPYRFKIDGHDYPTPNEGQTVAWRRTGPRAYETVMKKNGEIVSTTAVEISADAKTARISVGSPSGPAPSQTVFTRKTAYDPAEPLLGGWEVEAPLDTVAAAPNGIQWTSSSGAGFSAAFDSREYPLTGVSPATTVSIQKIDDRTLEETRKTGGAVVEKTRIELSEDGGTITRTTVKLNSPNVSPLVTKWVKEQ